MFQLEPYAPPIPVFLQCQLALQVTFPHVLFLLLHRQAGTPYRYIFALWRNSLPLSVNLSHISSSLLLLSSHPAPAPLITILALYKFICMYVCINKVPAVCYYQLRRLRHIRRRVDRKLQSTWCRHSSHLG